MKTKLRITERSAASLGFGDKPYEVWDSEVDGFGVRVWGQGKRAYIVRAKKAGKQAFKTLGRVGEVKADTARQEAIAFKGVVRSGRDPRDEEKAARNAWTLSDAMDYFRGSYADARKHSDAYKLDNERLFANHTPNRWKKLKLTELTHSMITARHKEITNGLGSEHNGARGGARRANAWLVLMRAIFNAAKSHRPPQCEYNPCDGVAKNDEIGRERFLSETELATLWRYLEDHENVEAAVCVQFIILTGCRPGEAFKMKWGDYDAKARMWAKPASNTKQRKKHVVSLTDEATRVLGRLETSKRSSYVFPSPGDATKPRDDRLKAFWRHTRKNCALPDVRLYDCRHSFASWLAMGGASLLEIGAHLGHADPRTTLRYAHFSHDHLRTNADLMAKTIADALARTSVEQDSPRTAEDSWAGLGPISLPPAKELARELFGYNDPQKSIVGELKPDGSLTIGKSRWPRK